MLEVILRHLPGLQPAESRHLLEPRIGRLMVRFVSMFLLLVRGPTARILGRRTHYPATAGLEAVLLLQWAVTDEEAVMVASAQPGAPLLGQGKASRW